MPAVLDLIDNAFSGVLGPARGPRIPLHLSADTSRFATVIEAEGFDEMLRELGPHRRGVILNPALAALLAQRSLDLVWAHESQLLQAWLKSVALRPHWCLNAYASGMEIHLFSNGHEFADSEDLYDAVIRHDTEGDERPQALCGAQPNQPLLINRGVLAAQAAAARPNPAAAVLCPVCAEHAPEYPEAGETSSLDLLPAPVLISLIKHWRGENAEGALDIIAAGGGSAELCETLGASLDRLVLDWTTDIMHRYPRPNALRALRSNGARLFGVSPINNQDKSVFVPRAAAIAELKYSPAQWRVLLSAHLADTREMFEADTAGTSVGSKFSATKASNTWALTLMSQLD
jgi:hypothetical protein